MALASASAGFAWTPFNGMTEQAVAERHQKRVLSIVSNRNRIRDHRRWASGFGPGRLGRCRGGSPGWVFAALSLSVIVAPQILLSKRDGFARGARLDMRKTLQRLRCREAIPLYGLAFSFGATNGTYLSYWIDHISQSGGLAGVPVELIGPVLFVVFGLAGCLGPLTGDLEKGDRPSCLAVRIVPQLLSFAAAPCFHAVQLARCRRLRRTARCLRDGTQRGLLLLERAPVSGYSVGQFHRRPHAIMRPAT